MSEGEFVEIGPPQNVISDPQDERSQAFLARFLRA